jgi:uncharacterized alkaline shock family protein YloU
MVDTHDEGLSTYLPDTPNHYDDQALPSVSHEVIASYVAGATRSVEGILDLHTSAWKGLSNRRREIQTGGVEIRDTPSGTVDAEIHVSVAWGSVIPELASQVEAAVRERVSGLLNIDLGTVTLFVDEIAGPTEEGNPQEG